MTRAGADPLGDVRPGRRPSWWLREALAADPGAPVAPLVGETKADVLVVGGGYTGLWAAYFLTELDPAARVVLLEQGICGGGPSGRNGGFVTAWWDELPALVADFGEERGLAMARAMAAAVDEVGAWTEAHGVDAWYRRAGYVVASAAPAQDDAFAATLETCARLGVREECVALSPAEVQARCASPILRGGVFLRSGATVQPAILARGLRRVLLERGVVIHEGTRVVEIDGRREGLGRPWGSSSSGASASSRPGRSTRGPVIVRTDAGGVPGEVRAEQVVLGLNAWAAAWPWSERRLLTWSSYIVLTEPIPDRLAELGWTGGEGLCDARFTLHYLRTTRDGRIALGGGGGRAGWAGRIGDAFTADTGSARRAAAGLRALFPSLDDVRIEDAWGGPIDICDDHRPFYGTLPGGRIHLGHGYSGNGVAPAHLGGRILAALALERRDDRVLDLPIVGRRPRRFPPEPIRSVGARVVREAVVRRESAEAAGLTAHPLVRGITRLPRRFGYHLGPD
jgi:glycine/D-amino acid oxidase-like deaminating enzyme